MPKRVLIAPVDRPGWAVSDVNSLLLSQRSSTLASNGRRGHPLILDEQAITSILGAQPEVPLRDLVAFEEVVVNAPLLGLNIDLPEDLALLKKHESTLLEIG